MNYILILSAKKLNNSVSNIKDLPSCLCPLGDRTILDCICERYKNNTNNKIKIIAYENYQMILDYIANKSYGDCVYVLEKLGTLYDSIKCFFEKCCINADDTLTIAFGDTIIENTDEFNNVVYYSKIKNYSSRWTYFKHQNGKITDISDKKIDNPGYDDAFVGYFKISNPVLFMEIMNKTKNKDFYYVLAEYSKYQKFSFIEAINWIDVGHADNYVESQMSVKTRTFNHIEIDKHRGILKKTSTELDKFKGEIEWYLKLPKDISYIAPRIFDYSTDYNDMYVEMECYGYNTIHDLFLYGNLERSKWRKIFSNIHFIMLDMMKYKKKVTNTKKILYNMYVKKTIDRLLILRNDRNFINFFDDVIIVNGVKYPCLNDIISDMNGKFIKLFDEDIDFNIIHGDLCFANMLIDDKLNFIKLIDPRGKFDSLDIYGDYRYDVAKLFHSVDGKYDYIIKDLFDIKCDGNNIIYNGKWPKCDAYVLDELLLEFNDMIKNNINQIYFIESMLFFSMIPLHTENVNHQLAMLCTALLIYNRF